MTAQAQSSCVAVTQASVSDIDMDNRDILLWTIITRADAEQVLQAFCWGREANLPWLLHEGDGLRGAHVATSSPSRLRLLQVRGSRPVCTPAGDLDCEATQLSCTDNSTDGNISLAISQCLDKLPLTGTSASSQAPDRNVNQTESLLDLLPVPADQHVDAHSWDEAIQQVRERATPDSILEAAEAWLRLIWLDAAYKHLQPVHAILTKHGRRLSVLRPLVAAIHARCGVQCPAQDQQQQKQLQELLPGCQSQELQHLLALVEAAVVNLHPHPQWLQQQLIPIVTKKLQLSQVQVTGLHSATDPAPVPAVTAADRAAVRAEETGVAGVAGSVHQGAPAKAANRKGQVTSAMPARRMKRPEPADTTGAVSKRQRKGVAGQVTLDSQRLKSNLKAAGKQASESLPKQPVSVAEAPAEQSAGVGDASQHQQFAGPAEQQVARVQHPADSSSPAAASTTTAAAPPSGAKAGGSEGSPGASVKLPRLSYSGGARRAPVGRHISIKLAVNDPLSGVNTATAPAAAAGAGVHVSDSAEVDKQHLEADGVSAVAADAVASVDVTLGKGSKPSHQLAELAAKQEQQQPTAVTQQQQQQQQLQSPAAADLGADGGMLNKAADEVFMPQQATLSMQRQQQKQSTGHLHGAAEQSVAGVPAAGAATGTAGGPSAAHSADAAPTAARSASSGLSAGRHTAPVTHDGGVAAAIKQEVKQEYDLGLSPAASVGLSKQAAGANGDTKSAATNVCVDGRHIICTSATHAVNLSSPAASGAAEGRSGKPPDNAVAGEPADFAVAAAAKPTPAADRLHAGHATQQCSATSSPPTAMAAYFTNPASSGAAAVAPSSRTATSAEVLAVKSSAARTGSGHLPPAKRASIHIPLSAATAERLASMPAVAQQPQGKESGAASGAGGADDAPPAKRARIPIPKPLFAGHSEPAAEKPAAAAGSDAAKYASAAPPTASAIASRTKADLRTLDEEYLLTLFDDFKVVHQQLKDIQRPQLQHTSSGTLVQLHWYLHHVDERMKRQLRDDEHALTFLRKFPRVFRLQYPGSSGRAGDVLFGLQPGAEYWLQDFLLEGVQPLLGKYKVSLKQAILASVDGKASMQSYGIPLSVAGALLREEGYMLPNLYPYTKLYPTFRSFVEARLCDEFSITEPCEGRQRELVLKQPPPPPPPPPPPAPPTSRHISRQLSSSSSREYQQTKQQQQISKAPPPGGCHDSVAVAPRDVIPFKEQLSEDLQFDQLVAEYRANLRECILHTAATHDDQGVTLACAGNPHGRLSLMSRKLLEMCKEKCGSFRNFVEQYLSDEFETVQPDADRPGHTVLTLRSDTISSAAPSQPPSSTVPAAVGGAELAVEPVADLRLLQLLAEYKERLREHILQQEPVNGWRGVDLGKAGAPDRGIMTPELFDLKNKLGGYYLGIRTFVEDFLGDEFKLVRPDPKRPALSMIVLHHNSRFQQHQLYDSAAAAVEAVHADVVSKSDSLAAAPASAVLTADPRSNPVFLQLLTEYKDRLRGLILQEPGVDGWWGVELGKAGNPQLNIMTPELFEYKNQLGYGMRDFVREFLQDEFELVQPDAHCQLYYMIVLRHHSRHQQQLWGPADDTGIAAGGAEIAHSSAESLEHCEDQLPEQLISPHQSQQQQLASSLPQVGQEQLFAEHWSEPWLRGLGSGHSAGSSFQPSPPPPPPPPRTSAAAGSTRHSAWSGASVFERLSSPRDTLPGHSTSVPNRGPQARRGSVATPEIPLQLAEDLDLAIIALFLQHAKEQQQAAMIFLEEGEVPTTLQVAPVTGLSTEDKHLIDSLGSFSMPCAVFTECLLQSSCVDTVDQRVLVSDWLGYLCDSGVLIQGSDAVDDAAGVAMTAEASMSIRLDVADMLHRLLKHCQLQGLIPQIEQALVNHLSAKARFPGVLGVPRLEVGKATDCLREDFPQLRPYHLLPGFLKELVRKSSLRSSFWYGPSIKPPSMKEKRLWFVEIRVQAAQDWGYKLTECIRVSDEGACRYEDYCFFSHVRKY